MDLILTLLAILGVGTLGCIIFFIFSFCAHKLRMRQFENTYTEKVMVLRDDLNELDRHCREKLPVVSVFCERYRRYCEGGELGSIAVFLERPEVKYFSVGGVEQEEEKL